MASLPHTIDAANSEDKTVRVAIIGGGIGGLCLALGLLKQSDLDVQVYEAAHAFSEIGAGVALGHNAKRALELIGPKAKQAMEKHATGNLWASHSDTFAEYKVVSCISPSESATSTDSKSKGRRGQRGHTHLRPKRYQWHAERTLRTLPRRTGQRGAGLSCPFQQKASRS